MGLGIYKAYHWPGFASSQPYDGKNFIEMFRRKAFEIQGKEVPTVPVPPEPKLLPIQNAWSINWQGSLGASGYHVFRAENENGPWTQIAYIVSDAAIPYFPNYHDKLAEIGKTYYYRVTAINASGESGTSNVVGPVKVEKQALVDDMINFMVLYHSENLELSSGNDRAFKEDFHRMKGDTGAHIIYKTRRNITDFRVYSFEETEEAALKIVVSTDGEEFKEIEVNVSRFNQPGTNYYGYQYPVLYEQTDLGKYQYLKLVFEKKAELVRVEICYN
jgi:hypothetical protein